MTTSEPLLTVFEVACSADHAFDVWTRRIGTWWPKDHTVAGVGDVDVLIEAGVGGRILERRADGEEHVWGEITTWEPPSRLGFRWHLGRPPEPATDVEVRFLPQGADVTRVEIEQQGWERFGEEAATLRERNHVGWSSLLPHFTEIAEEG